MVRLIVLGAAAFLVSTASAQTTQVQCGDGVGNCPSDQPCCSQYGQCGIGAYCLGGCDPRYSFELGSCVPSPQCKSATYQFTDPNSSPILPTTKYLGDPNTADWVSDGQPLFANGAVYLTMAPGTVGTVLASSRYVWYGKISVTMKTSRGQGVVTADILLSDVKDEIDYEWVGTQLTTSQTNYYWNGVPAYTNSGKITMSSSTDSSWHTYTVDWTPDSITWSVDGQIGRVKNRADTYNATTGNWMYPQTPSRIELSLWPGGLSTNGEGTIQWAGGPINWDSPDIQQYGYDFAIVSEVVVECYNPPPGAQGTGTTSYQWLNKGALNTSVLLSNEGTIIDSLLATGTNKTIQLPSAASSTTTVVSTNSAGKATTIVSTIAPTNSGVETVPGLNDGGYNSGDLNGGPNGGNNGGNNGPNGTGTINLQSTNTGFSQSNNGPSSSAVRIFAFGDKYLIWGNIVAIILVAAGMATL